MIPSNSLWTYNANASMQHMKHDAVEFSAAFLVASPSVSPDSLKILDRVEDGSHGPVCIQYILMLLE